MMPLNLYLVTYYDGNETCSAKFHQISFEEAEAALNDILPEEGEIDSIFEINDRGDVRCKIHGVETNV